MLQHPSPSSSPGAAAHRGWSTLFFIVSILEAGISEKS